MNPKTRNLINWEEDADYFTLNEAAENEWMKRWDILFQIHPRFDWERNNNFASPNHPLFIKEQSGDCIFCAGTGKATKDGQEVDCPWCEAGQYILPEHRKGKIIIMQDQNDDVPGCQRLPIEDMIKTYCKDGKPYLTSTFSHMMVFALYASMENYRYSDITLYGFEMESDTEYAHQRACAEYWIGYGRALGIKIEAPGAKILTGQHYAYETSAQGERTRLELRINHLKAQLRNAEAEAIKSEGALNAITPFKGIPEVTPAFDLHFDEHFRRKGFVSFLRGAIQETENTIRMHDAYNADGNERPSDAAQMLGLTYELGG